MPTRGEYFKDQIAAKAKKEKRRRFVLGVLEWIVFIPLFGGSALYNAFVGAILWDWFAASQLGLPHITMFQFLGIVILVGFFLKNLATFLQADKIINPTHSARERRWDMVTLGYIGPSIFWAAGYIVQRWLL